MKNEFSVEQVQELFDQFLSQGCHLPEDKLSLHFLAKYNYVKRKQKEGQVHTSLFGLLRKVIGEL